MQVVSTGLAIVLLWGFVIWGLVKPRYMNAQVNEWKSWISYNFTWFYIGAFVSQPSPVSNTVLLPPSREPEFGNFGNFGEFGGNEPLWRVRCVASTRLCAP